MTTTAETVDDGAYIRTIYQVPAWTGRRVIALDRPGVIVGFFQHYLLVRLDGDPEVDMYHPTWRVEYPEDLNRNDLEVLARIAQGKTNAEIAGELFLSTEAVRSRAGRLYERIGARDRAHAVHLAWKQGYLPMEP